MMVSVPRRSFLSLLLLSAQPCVTAASFIATLPAGAQDMFNQSMAWLDSLYDPAAHYLYDVSQGTQTSLNHETRASAWYAVGLLARNNGSDVDEAAHIIRNVIDGQFKDPADQWFGTYQKYPEEPTVGTAAYPASIYSSWDPNWRGFIGTAFIQALSDFPHLLSAPLTSLMLASLRNASVGDSYRVGGLDGDNLYPAYTNPALMRAFVSGWTGRRLRDANLTAAGEADAAQVVALFDRAATLAEFNSGTYAGISLHALALWARYLPAANEPSIMAREGPRLLRDTWASVARLYHAGLRNSAGPWDRTYGYDMTRYVSVLALHAWSLVGRDASPLGGGNKQPPYAMGHSGDYAFAPLVALAAPRHNALVPPGAVAQLRAFPGEHAVRTSAFSPPYDEWPRNVSAWLADRITIGAATFDERRRGGPALSPDAWSPAVVQWAVSAAGNRTSSSSSSSSSAAAVAVDEQKEKKKTDRLEVGWLKWYATESALAAHVSPGVLSLTYPKGNASSVFSFMVSTFEGVPDVGGWEDLQGVRVNVSGNAELEGYAVQFHGAYGGAGETVNDFEFWNFTYSMPEGFEGTPNLVLSFDVE